MNWLVCLPIGMIAIWAWANSFELALEEETDTARLFSLGVCWEMVLVAVGASVACAASLWTA